MSWQLHDDATRIRALIMVSRLGHCLNDLLFRWKAGSLPVDVAGVVPTTTTSPSWPRPTGSRSTTSR